MDIKHWLTQAGRLHTEAGYTYCHFAHELTQQLTWPGAVEVATALRGHVYGWTGGHPLHAEIKPLYDRLGWEQAALIAAWFRNLNNKPQKRKAGWPTAIPTATESSCRPQRTNSSTAMTQYARSPHTSPTETPTSSPPHPTPSRD